MSRRAEVDDRLDLDAMDEAAYGTTPGPWHAGRTDMQSYEAATGEPFGSVYWDNPRGKLHLGHRLPGVVARTKSPARNQRDACYIAAFHPKRGKALVRIARAAVKLKALMTTTTGLAPHAARAAAALFREMEAGGL